MTADPTLIPRLAREAETRSSLLRQIAECRAFVADFKRRFPHLVPAQAIREQFKEQP